MGNQNKLEVEKKYFYNDDLDQRLKNLNSKEKYYIEIIDEYYDTDNYLFIRKDYWLRSRHIQGSEKSWQLKYPTESHSPGFCKYFETTDQQDIIGKLSKISNFDTKFDNLENFINILRLKIFASFKTTRKSFTLDGITIDLDETDFGYKLAELEILLDADSAQDMVQQSMQRIRNLAERLGMQEHAAGSNSGKMFAYFSKFKPEICAIVLKERNSKALN